MMKAYFGKIMVYSTGFSGDKKFVAKVYLFNGETELVFAYGETPDRARDSLLARLDPNVRESVNSVNQN